MADSKPKCEAKVHPRDRWGSFHPHTCNRTGKVQVDGKWYCGIHDPIKKAQKDAERSAAWDAKWEVDKIKRAKEQLAIECHDDLVAALEHAILRDHPYSPQSCAGCNAACAALARARGEK